MIPAVAAAIDAIVGNVTALSHARGAGRAYELYIMTGIAEALVARGCRVSVQRSDGTIIAPSDADRAFHQRDGVPTGVFGAMQGAANGSSFLVQLPGSRREWEIWNGIQFMGRSGGTHELDIAVVPREVGQALRARPAGGTPIGRPMVAIECKDVGRPGSPDEMRAFVARLYDLTILGSHLHLPHLPPPFGSINPNAPPEADAYGTFWDGNRRTYNVLVRRTGFTAGATAMTAYYGVQPRGPMAPGTADDVAFVTELATWITKALA